MQLALASGQVTQATVDQRVFEREEGSGIPRMFVYTRKADAPHPCFVDD